MGDYVLTAENLITGPLADDDVAMGGYHIGIHQPNGRGWRWDCSRLDRLVSGRLWQSVLATAPQSFQGLRMMVGAEALPTGVASTLRGLGPASWPWLRRSTGPGQLAGRRGRLRVLCRPTAPRLASHPLPQPRHPADRRQCLRAGRGLGHLCPSQYVLGWPAPLIIAGAGSVIAAISVTAILFEGFPFHSFLHHGAAAPRLAQAGLAAATLAVTVVVFTALHWVGSALTRGGTGQAVDLWVGVSGMNYIVGAALLHQFIWGRWPLPAPRGTQE